MSTIEYAKHQELIRGNKARESDLKHKKIIIMLLLPISMYYAMSVFATVIQLLTAVGQISQ